MAAPRSLGVACEPRMGTLFFIRHGQASYGVADYDNLSELGVRQARRVGATAGGGLLREVDAVYVGPLRRQRDTASHLRAAAAEAGHAVPEGVELPELEEYPAFELLAAWVPRLAAEDPSFGALVAAAGDHADRVRLLDRAFETIIGRWARGELPPEGIESFEHFTARVRRGIDRMVAAHAEGRGARVAAVTSGGVIGVAMQLALGLDHQAATSLWRNVRNASISEFAWRSAGFAWRPGDFSVVGFNHVQHLGDAELLTFR
ncbi:MAG: histidine phosphatase family protein [Kofleriaceae bacterium]|nr:histidine phosphatase family protein [Kofleriaceae bacterium]